MTTSPSIKNVSTSDIEAAFAKALKELTGWENCSVDIGAADYPNPLGGESVKLNLTAWFRGPAVSKDDLPF